MLTLVKVFLSFFIFKIAKNGKLFLDLTEFTDLFLPGFGGIQEVRESTTQAFGSPQEFVTTSVVVLESSQHPHVLREVVNV